MKAALCPPRTRDPNIQNKPAYKKDCSYCHRANHSISACFRKHRGDEENRDAYVRSKSPPSNDRTKRYDTHYRSRRNSRTNYYNENTNSQNRYRSRSRDRFSYDKNNTPPQYTRSRYETINEIRDPIALLTDLFTDPLVGMTLVINIDHVHIQEITTISQDRHLHIDHIHDQESLDTLDHVRIPIQRKNLIQYNHITKMTHLNSKYTCIIQLKWQTL